MRNIKEADIKSIVKIYNDSMQNGVLSGAAKSISEKEKKAQLQERDLLKYPTLVIEYHDKIIAYLDIKPYPAWERFDKTCEVSIYLDRNFQGQKLGQHFLENALKKINDLGYKNILAFILRDNLASIKLFKKFNFKEWGCFPKIAMIDGSEKDLIILGLRIE